VNRLEKKMDEEKILYSLELTMSEVKSAYELEFGEPPAVVLHTPEGWLIRNDLVSEGLKDDEEL